MTSRSDLARVFAALQVLGTEAGQHLDDGRTKIVLAWDRTAGWEIGPRRPPPQWEPTSDDPPPPSSGDLPVDDERASEHQQRRRAAEHHSELVETITTIDRATQVLFRLIDLAVPPNPAEVKNRRTGDYEPMTLTEVELNGWCSSCWRVDQTLTPIYVDRNGMRRWKGSCSWCGPIRSEHGIDPPRDLLAKHLDGKNISTAEFDQTITRTKDQPKPKRRKGKKKTAA